MAVLSGLEPGEVFRYFEKLCSVPHGSGNTKRISDMCADFARELGLPFRQDALNNLIIWKSASPGYEAAPPIILQGHLDMVCARAEGCVRDMSSEGVELATDGEYVWAEGTSLGGDDGIAVAMILAVLTDESLPHPPLEAVFTVDEETGMDGARALDCSALRGRRLLNLDSEEEGVFTVSCAGGVRADCFLPARREALAGEACYAVTVSGLRGGHSGADIHLGRASANQLAGRVLYGAMERVPGLRAAEIRGGRFDNVICTENEAHVAVPAGEAAELEAFLRKFDRILKNEYAGSDGGVALRFERTEFDRALTRRDTAVLLRALAALPQGVEAMSADFPGLVQTSLNLGIMGMEEDGLHLSVSIRSSMESQKEMLLQRVRAIVEQGGGTVSPRAAYPGWEYARSSALRELVLAAYRDTAGREGAASAIHAGLECGLFAEKLPGLDAVSFGPDIYDVHSPRERLGVASTGRVYRLLREILRRGGD